MFFSAKVHKNVLASESKKKDCKATTKTKQNIQKLVGCLKEVGKFY